MSAQQTVTTEYTDGLVCIIRAQYATQGIIPYRLREIRDVQRLFRAANRQARNLIANKVSECGWSEDAAAAYSFRVRREIKNRLRETYLHTNDPKRWGA